MNVDRSSRLLRVVFTLSIAVVASGAAGLLSCWGGLNGPQALITALSSFGGVTTVGLNLVEFLAGQRVPALEPQSHGCRCAHSGTSTAEGRSSPASGRSLDRFDLYPVAVVVADVVGRGQAKGLRLPWLQVLYRSGGGADDLLASVERRLQQQPRHCRSVGAHFTVHGVHPQPVTDHREVPELRSPVGLWGRACCE